jgi:hypothetical protein
VKRIGCDVKDSDVAEGKKLGDKKRKKEEKDVEKNIKESNRSGSLDLFFF